MALLKTIVLVDVVKVMSPNDNRSLHFVGHNHTLENTTTNRHGASEGALLVDVLTTLRLFWGCKAKANVFPVPQTFLMFALVLPEVRILGDTLLLLERFFMLQARSNKSSPPRARGIVHNQPEVQQ
eukprot:Lankesteria_metandrocarpae@DN37_c0_g1_i1.p1